MSERVWTDEEVANLRKRQALDYFHPYTCTCSDHVKLVPTPEGWRCPVEGRVVQRWAHEADTSGKSLTWEDPLATLARIGKADV